MTKEKPSEMEEQNKYETMVILDPNLGAEETAKKVQEIKDLIVSSGGEVTHEDDWGARDLAYKLRGNKEGYYYVLNFTLDPSKIKKLVKHMKLEKHALRSLIIKLDAHYRVKTLKQYEEEAVVAEAEEKKKKEEEEKEKGRPKERKTPQPKKIKKPVVEEPKEEEKEEKVEEAPVEDEKVEEPVVAEEPAAEEAAAEEKTVVAEEPAAEEAPAAEEKPAAEEEKDKKKELDDLDKKLQSIINDPDIIL